MGRIVFIALILVSLVGCSGSSRYYKMGSQLSEAGLHREASERYMEALRRNRNNVSAQIALRVDGQRVLDGHLQEFYLAHTSGDHTKAVREYELATRYQEMVRRYGVNLSFPENYRPMYQESEDIHLEGLYRQANDLIDDQKFAEAEVLLREIARFRSDYGTVQELKDVAFLEPRYQEALEAMDDEQFRRAYALLTEITTRDPNFRDARRLRETARERGVFSIGILPFENKSNVRNIESLIMARLLAEVNGMNDPFLRLIDRTNTDRIIAEQRLSLEGVIDQNTAVIAGELMGAKALLKATILDAREVEGELQTENRKGFLGTPINVKDPATGAVTTQMQYNRVFYQHFTRENEVFVSIQYQLVSTATGEILLSDVVEMRRSDRADYSRFEGDHRHLFAGTWENQRRPSPNDRMYNSPRAKRELNSSLQASDQVESVSNLRSQLVRDLSARVAQQLQSFNPER
jgi:hypothetical protein